MNFDNIFDRLHNRIWAPMSDIDAVDMIINSYVDGYIDDEEKTGCTCLWTREAYQAKGCWEDWKQSL